MAQIVKNLPAMQVAWVQSLDGEDPLEKGMVTHSSILSWEIPWTEEPNGLCNSPLGCKELNTTEQISLSLHFFFSPGILGKYLLGEHISAYSKRE